MAYACKVGLNCDAFANPGPWQANFGVLERLVIQLTHARTEMPPLSRVSTAVIPAGLGHMEHVPHVIRRH